jgi:hypothetical protein
MEAITATEHTAQDMVKRWEALKTSDLPALNRDLKQANLPELKIEESPHAEDQDNMDED